MSINAIGKHVMDFGPRATVVARIPPMSNSRTRIRTFRRHVSVIGEFPDWPVSERFGQLKRFEETFLASRMSKRKRSTRPFRATVSRFCHWVCRERQGSLVRVEPTPPSPFGDSTNYY